MLQCTSIIISGYRIRLNIRGSNTTFLFLPTSHFPVCSNSELIEIKYIISKHKLSTDTIILNYTKGVPESSFVSIMFPIIIS